MLKDVLVAKHKLEIIFTGPLVVRYVIQRFCTQVAHNLAVRQIGQFNSSLIWQGIEFI